MCLPFLGSWSSRSVTKVPIENVAKPSVTWGHGFSPFLGHLCAGPNSLCGSRRRGKPAMRCPFSMKAALSSSNQVFFIVAHMTSTPPQANMLIIEAPRIVMCCLGFPWTQHQNSPQKKRTKQKAAPSENPSHTQKNLPAPPRCQRRPLPPAFQVPLSLCSSSMPRRRPPMGIDFARWGRNERKRWD